MIDQIKKDFLLSKDWGSPELSERNLHFRWSFQNSKIYIKNVELYTHLKLRIYNGVESMKRRVLKISTNEVDYKEYIFTDTISYIDIKLDIKNVNCVTFHTDDYLCPKELDDVSSDDRKLGFKFFSIIVDSINQSDTLVAIKELMSEQDEISFLDSSVYDFNITRLSVNNTKPSIFYVGQYGTSGYATAAKGYIYKYFITGHPIKWSPLVFDNSVLSKDNPYNLIVESIINANYNNYDNFIYHSTPDLWKSINKKFDNINEGRNIIGYTVWETNILPNTWVNQINNQVNEVWCPSSYNFEVFKNSGVTIPIKIVPHVFLRNPLFDKKDIELCSYTGETIINRDDVYTFYAIGEYNERKGIEDLIKVFCNVFTKHDKVRLLIKTHYKDYGNFNKNYCLSKINELLKNYTDKPEIHCIVDNMSEKEIVALHSIGDCYVSLTKSEGFGLTIFDAFNYGKKVIATGYSGHLDFLGKDYSGLVNYKLDYVKNMKEFKSAYSEDTIWAYPDLQHAAELMKGIIK